MMRDIIAHLNAPAGSHFARNEQGVFERIDLKRWIWSKPSIFSINVFCQPDWF